MKDKIKLEIERETAMRLKEMRHGLVSTYDAVINELLDQTKKTM